MPFPQEYDYADYDYVDSDSVFMPASQGYSCDYADSASAFVFPSSQGLCGAAGPAQPGAWAQPAISRTCVAQATPVAAAYLPDAT